MSPLEIYRGSDGAATKALYAELEKRGPFGLIALNLFRSQKCSERAKVYRGGVRGRGSYKSMAYDRKSWSMDNLCAILAEYAEAFGIRWGWKEDPSVVFGQDPSWVMYVDLPRHGQVSFHSPSRGKGPDYRGEWDGQVGMSVQRVIDFAANVLQLPVASVIAAEPESEVHAS
jgi:hypothetical protein